MRPARRTTPQTAWSIPMCSARSRTTRLGCGTSPFSARWEISTASAGTAARMTTSIKPPAALRTCRGTLTTRSAWARRRMNRSSRRMIRALPPCSTRRSSSAPTGGRSTTWSTDRFAMRCLTPSSTYASRRCSQTTSTSISPRSRTRRPSLQIGARICKASSRPWTCHSPWTRRRISRRTRIC